MLYITTIRQGNSLAVVIPAIIAKEMKLTRGLTFLVTAPDTDTVIFKRLTPETLKKATATASKKSIRYYANTRTSKSVR